MNKDNKKLVIESVFIKEALKKKLSLEEFLILLYFDNAYDNVFDIKKISNVLKMDENSILTAFQSLTIKKIITLETTKNESNKSIELININNFYNDIIIDKKETENQIKETSIFGLFESSFGRPLSPMDYEIIKAWLEKGFSEQLIKGALNEAIYNGVTSLRYIDKILFEWKKKGLNSVEDVSNHLKNKEESVNCETKVLNFDWLNEDE